MRFARSRLVVLALSTLAATQTLVPAVGVSAAQAASAPPASLAQYPLPNPNTEPYDLAAGPDGNMWTPYNFRSTIGRLTPAGDVREFSVPPFLVFPVITAGADGNLWFLPSNASVVRMTPDGAAASFPIPGGNGGPNDIALGPDGNVWFTQFQTGQVGFVTPAGDVSVFDPPGASEDNSHPRGITGGADGNVWFTEPFKNTVGRVTPSGVITEFSAPNAPQNNGPDMITDGPDGNLWYTKPNVGVIGRVTPSGVFTEFYLPVGTRPDHIAKGPDANLWFTDSQNNQIGRITTEGKVGLFTLPRSAQGFSRGPRNITTGPDGRLWFTIRNPASLGAFAPFAPDPSPPDVRSIVPPDSTTNGGTKVLITGYDIGTATQVLFGDTPATSFKAVGPGQLEAVAPPHAAGEVDVTVVTRDGTTEPSAGSNFYYSSTECGRVITASIALGADIGPCYGDGVIIRADDITLDLGGHRIYGFTAPSDGHAAGVRLPGRTGVTVKNGTVSGFDAGVYINRGSGNTLTNLTIKDNIGPDDPFNSQFGDGVFIEDSPSNRIVGNTISHNGIFDGIGIYGPKSNANRVEGNVVENNIGPSDGGPSGSGIVVNGATGTNTTFISLTRIERNVVRNNASSGIANVNHVKGSILENTVEGNGATNSIGNGIGVSVGFNWDKGPTLMLIQGNEVHGNGVDGIRIGDPRGFGRGSPTRNKILDNDAADNNAKCEANRYEGGCRRPAFDLHDSHPDCDDNVWSGNTWGSGGYSPACTATGGTGPKGAAGPPAATSEQGGGPSGTHGKEWAEFLARGRP